MKKAVFVALFLSAFFSFAQTHDDSSRNTDIISLREYVDLRFAVTQRAIDKAEVTMNERLAGMNEFRLALKDQNATFITRQELWASLLAVCGLILGVMNYQLNKMKKNGPCEPGKK
jgi:hypothetical protein